MAAIKLFYGSTNGNTERVADLIKSELGNVEVINIAKSTPKDIESANKLIFGTSTWQDGELQEDWEEFFPSMDEIDFSGKTIALFGLGDSYGYPDAFVNGLGILAEKIKEKGGKLVGNWSTEGYDFESSSAVQNGNFVGLAIDEENESDKTETRVKEWVASIKPSFA